MAFSSFVSAVTNAANELRAFTTLSLGISTFLLCDLVSDLFTIFHCPPNFARVLQEPVCSLRWPHGRRYPAICNWGNEWPSSVRAISQIWSMVFVINCNQGNVLVKLCLVQDEECAAGGTDPSVPGRSATGQPWGSAQRLAVTGVVWVPIASEGRKARTRRVPAPKESVFGPLVPHPEVLPRSELQVADGDRTGSRVASPSLQMLVTFCSAYARGHRSFQ